MKDKMRSLLLSLISCLLPLALGACGGSAPLTANQTTNQANRATASNAASTPSAPTVSASPRSSMPPGGGGEPVDTAKYDAEIKRLEEKAKKNSVDQQTRLALAKAYTERGDALTSARQYRAALGDYRRALRNDPNNEQAQQMSGTIVGILKSMGRDVPAEGQEPAPLPLKQ